MSVEIKNLETVRDRIASAKRILISGHLSPDGDSIGSIIALARLLTAAGHVAYATADLNAIGKLRFLEGVEDIIPLSKLRNRSFDLFIAVDCASFDRLPPEVRPIAQNLPKVCIDHHVTNDGSFAEASLVDATASSAGQIVWEFAHWMKWPLDQAIAEALWVAIVTDSGRFAYDMTTSETFLAASDLMKYGVRTSWINDVLYVLFSRKAVELKRRAWRTLHIWKNGRVAEVTLTRDDFRDVRGTKADAEDVIDIPRSVLKNEIALFFYQIPDRTKETRCSIRTRGVWDATVLAAKFGGGGHMRAAGCTIQSSLAGAKRRMRAAVREWMKSGGRRSAETEDENAANAAK